MYLYHMGRYRHWLVLIGIVLLGAFSASGWGCDSGRGRTETSAEVPSGFDSGVVDEHTSPADQANPQPDANTPTDTGSGQDTAPDDTTAPEQGVADAGAADTATADTSGQPDVVTQPDVGSPDTATQPDTVTQPDTPNPQGPQFYLYDEDAKTFVLLLSGAVDLKPFASRATLNIALKVSDPRVKSVRFFFDSEPPRHENAAAYTVFHAGDHRDKLTAGTHTIRAIVYDGPSSTGNVLSQPITQFVVKEAITTPTTPGGQHLPKDPTKIPADPTFSQTKNVNQTIVISKSGVYDYKGVLHIWTGSGSCNQTENQPHIMRIEASNVTVKNFAYRNAPDGIHIATCSKGQGNTCTGSISNITLDNVTGWACEDALTTGKGTSKITIRNSFFLGNPNNQYRDKCLQINFGKDLTIEYTMFKNCKRPVRFKSGSNITLLGNRFYLFDQAVKGDTSPDISGIVPNITSTVDGQKNHFQDGQTAYFAEGKTQIVSTNDVFQTVRKRSEVLSGGKVTFK